MKAYTFAMLWCWTKATRVTASYTARMTFKKFKLVALIQQKPRVTNLAGVLLVGG